MKKKLLYIIPIIIIILTVILIIIFRNNKIELEDKYYNKNEIIEITKEDLDTLINNKESFLLFVYQPLCANSYNFSVVLDHFIDTYNITICKIAFSDLKETNLKEYIKTYPSFGIFKDGELIDHLNATSNEDTAYFKTLYGFSTWISEYVDIPKLDLKELEEDYEEEQTIEIPSNIHKESKKTDIKNNKDKVTIILFYGDGCPHCRKLFNYLASLDKEYLDLFELYGFEVWNNNDNMKLLKEYKAKYNFDDDDENVPFIIINNNTYTGFDNDSKNEVLKLIVDAYKELTSTCSIDSDCM